MVLRSGHRVQPAQLCWLAEQSAKRLKLHDETGFWNLSVNVPPMRCLEHTRRTPRLRAALLAFCLVAALAVVTPTATAAAQALTIEQVNEQLGVGVNLGNALEGPREGDWGLTLQADYFSTIAQAGFKHVRVPIRFSAYTGGPPNYLIPDGIDPTVPNADNLWDRIDWVITHAENNGLYVILDLHLFDELSDDVAGERAKFLAIWEQIAQRYATASPWVLFELLNEPQGQFNDDPTLLNTLIADALDIIRVTNPTRPVLVAPSYWNQIGALETLELPSDPNLIVSVHFYDPFPFTHQGASWIEPVPAAPANFEPDFVSFGAGWGDWGWSSTAAPSPNSLEVTFDHQWGGVAFGRASAFTPATLNVEVAGASELAVRCALANDDNTEVTRITTSAAASTFNIDMSICPVNTQSINFMVRSPTFDVLNFSEIELCVTDGSCSRLVESGAQAIESAFDKAAAWGQANDRPIHVGEFGAYSANGVADLNERATWTETVRLAGESRGFSMSYWEFGAGFGVYDLSTQTWVQPLLDALGVEPPVPTPTDGLAGYVAVSPARILDSRPGQPGQGANDLFVTPWGSGMTRTVQVSGVGGVPAAGVSAVAIHVSSVYPTTDSFLTVWPDGPMPLAASKNYGVTVSGGLNHVAVTNDLLIVPVAGDGTVQMFNNAGTVDLVIDVVGYYTANGGDSFAPLTPDRILDSRPGQSGQGANDTFSTPWGPGTTRTVQVTGIGGVPATGVSAVTIQVTSVFPTADSFLTVWPDGAMPLAASKNYGTTETGDRNHAAVTNNLLIVPIDANGNLQMFNNAGTVDLVIDVVGYYTN